MALHVEFYTDTVENPAKTREENRPIFEEREFVRIRFPGDTKRELVAPAHEVHYVQDARMQMTYAEQYPEHYKAFQAGAASQIIGTPVDLATFLTPPQKAEFKAVNIHTIEQLAELGDREIAKLGPHARPLVEQAKTFIASASESAEVAALKARIADLENAAKPTAPVAQDDPYAGFEDEDLKNMIRDAGGDVPKGRATRATLVKALEAIAAQKEGETA